MRNPDGTIMFRIAFLAIVCAASHTFAQEVGKFAMVQNEVSSLRPGADQPVAAVVGASISLNESEITGDASRAKFVFGEGAVISIGQKTTFLVSQQVVDQATGKSTSKLDVAIGKLRVFVSRFASGRPEIQVDTPTAVVGIKGSDVLIEVEEGKTTVTVFGGSAEVRTKSVGTVSPPTLLTFSQQVVITPAGGVGNPIVLDGPVLYALWQLTEPIPEPPVEFPKNRPLRVAPDPLDRTAMIATDCVTCAGTTPIANPTTEATRDLPSTLEDPVNAGTKAARR